MSSYAYWPNTSDQLPCTTDWKKGKKVKCWNLNLFVVVLSFGCGLGVSLEDVGCRTHLLGHQPTELRIHDRFQFLKQKPYTPYPWKLMGHFLKAKQLMPAREIKHRLLRGNPRMIHHWINHMMLVIQIVFFKLKLVERGGRYHQNPLANHPLDGIGI